VQDLPPGRCPALAAVPLLPALSPHVTLPLAAVAPPRCPLLCAPRLPRMPVGRHLIATVENPGQALELLSFARTNTARVYTSFFLEFLGISQMPNPHPVVASPSQRRPCSASPWAATTKHSSPPSTPIATSPCPAGARQPLGAPQFWSELGYRRSIAAASASPWDLLSRPPLTPIDPGSSFLTPPGSFSTLPPSPKSTGAPSSTLLPHRRPPVLVTPLPQASPHEFQVPPGAQEFTGAPLPLAPRRRRSPTTDHADQVSCFLFD
jgi:hypothetical protein